jgi:hypothetical protein
MERARYKGMSVRVVHCKKERFDVYIGRPGPWGNDWSHKPGTLAKFKVNSVEESIDAFEKDLLSDPGKVALVKEHLRGKTLGCWCKRKGHEPCHGDVLLKVANG